MNLMCWALIAAYAKVALQVFPIADRFLMMTYPCSFSGRNCLEETRINWQRVWLKTSYRVQALRDKSRIGTTRISI